MRFSAIFRMRGPGWAPRSSSPPGSTSPSASGAGAPQPAELSFTAAHPFNHHRLTGGDAEISAANRDRIKEPELTGWPVPAPPDTASQGDEHGRRRKTAS